MGEIGMVLGPWAFALAGAAALGAVFALVLAVLVAARWRPPLFLWLIGPGAVAAVGALAFFVMGGRVAEALRMVSPDHLTVLAAAGWGEMLVALEVGLGLAALLLGGSAAALAVAVPIGAGSPARFTPAGAALGASVGLLSAGAGVAAVFAGGYPRSLLVLPVATAGFTFFAAVAGARLGEEPIDAARGAAGRAGVAVLAALAVAALAAAIALAGDAEAFRALAVADPGARGVIVAGGIATVAGAGTVGALSVLGVAVAASLPAAGASASLAYGGGRAALGAIGTGVLVAAIVAIVVGARAARADIERVAVAEDVVRVLRGVRDLPSPVGAMGGDIATACVAIGTPKGFDGRPVGPLPACAEGPLPMPPPGADTLLVAAPADMPAHLLARATWGEGDTALRVAIRAGDPGDASHRLLDASRWGVVQLLWAPPAGQGGVPEPVAVVDGAAGVEIRAAAAPPEPLPDGDARAARLAAIVADGGALVIEPGSRLTLGDVVEMCVAVRHGHPGARCVVTADAGLAAPEPAGRRVPDAAPSADGPEATGTDAAAVRDVVRRNSGQVKYCYERELKDHPDLAGRVEVSMNVFAGEVVGATALSNTTGSRTLQDCVIGKVRRWRFPDELTGEIVWPFVFQPSM